MHRNTNKSTCTRRASASHHTTFFLSSFLSVLLFCKFHFTQNQDGCWTGFTSLSQFAGENRRPGLAQSLREHFRRGQLWHHIIFMMLHCPPSRLSLAMYRFNQHKSVAEMSTNPRLHSPRRHSGDFKPILLHNQSALRLIRTSDAFMALILFNNINFYVKIVTYTLLSGMQT